MTLADIQPEPAVRPRGIGPLVTLDRLERRWAPQSRW
jgi:hypothetical protein